MEESYAESYERYKPVPLPTPPKPVAFEDRRVWTFTAESVLEALGLDVPEGAKMNIFCDTHHPEGHMKVSITTEERP